MRKVMVVVFLVVVLAGGAAFGQSAPERVRISYSSGGMTSIDLFIARDRKYFQDQKLNAELIRMSANLAITAGISGEATGKLFEYLASGRPILAVGGMNEAARIVTETGTGLAVDSDDEGAVLAGLRTAVSGALPYSPRGLDQYRYPSPALRVSELAEIAEARRGR